MAALQIKRQLRNPQAYENLLRCCHLFNLEIISRCELLCLITPLLSRCPDVLAWFKDMLGRGDTGLTSGGGGGNSASPPPPSHHSQASCAPTHATATPQSSHEQLPLRPIPHDTRPDLVTTAATADIGKFIKLYKIL